MKGLEGAAGRGGTGLGKGEKIFNEHISTRDGWKEGLNKRER